MEKEVVVIRKNGVKMKWDDCKIKKAISLSALTIQKELTDDFLNNISNKVLNLIKFKNENSYEKEIIISVNEIHDIVISILKEYDIEIYEQYKNYRDYKQRYYKSFENIKDETLRIVYNGDKENANKDSSLISTQKELIAGTVSSEMMLEWEAPIDSRNKHKNGLIYINDLRDHMFDSINCCLFDLENILKNGFELNGLQIEEPTTFETFIDLSIDILLVASSQQFGGFSYPEIDKVGSKYLKNTYNRLLQELLSYNIDLKEAEDIALEKTWKITLKKVRMFEYKVNCVLNATGQTPFFVMSFGLETDKFSKMISKAILTVRIEGMGKNKTTAVFPKLIFLHRNEINGDKNSPNYDLKQLAIKCSSKNQYPDWLSLDCGTLGETYDRCNKVVTMMGCRAHLSPWFDENGEEQYTGRFNIGCVTMQLVRIALDSNGDEDKFFELLDSCIESGINFHLYKYAKLSKQKASSNPLFFTQGGCIIKLNQDETLERALECATASIGYIGLSEACYVLSGKKLHENVELAEKIMMRLKNRVDEACKKYDRLFALYATPSEGLCDKALRNDKKVYGLIKNVTDDKEWYTNGHMVDVTAKISAIDKLKIEQVLYKYPTGGRIFYSEWPHSDNLEALEQYIDYCMKKGLYIGINFDNGTCLDCSFKGNFNDDVCPICGSGNVTIINRVCGYLGVFKANGETRYNHGKEEEVKNRFKHYNYIQDSYLE